MKPVYPHTPAQAKLLTSANVADMGKITMDLVLQLGFVQREFAARTKGNSIG